MRDLKALALGLFLTLTSFTGAFAQCGTQAPANKFCGNDTGSTALANWKAIPAGALAAIAGGTVLGNPTVALAVPVATTAPVLGIPGTSTGQIGFAGSAGGTAILRAQATAGSAVSLLPTAAGTLVGSSSAPLVIGAATGTLTCPTCVTSSGGGAITGTAPITVSAAGVVALTTPLALNFGGSNANLTASNGGIIWSNASQFQILAGTATARQMLQSGATATPAWSTAIWPATSAAGTIAASLTANTFTASANPVLGAVGTTGTLGFSGTTSGTATITPQATAGTPTLILPNTSGTFAVSATSPLVLSATTGALTCPTCTTSAASLTANQLVIGSGSQGEQSLGTLGTTTTVLHGNAGGAPTFGAVVSADLNITTTTCTNQFVTAISAGGVGTCTTATLASAQFANQGTTTTLLHGNAAGNPSFGQVVFADIATAAIATGANYLAGTSSTTLIPPNIIYQAETTTTFGSTTTFDFSTFINTNVTLTANITTQTLSNVTAGKAGTISFTQSGAGSFTTVWNTIFKFAGGTTPTLTTGSATAVDVLTYSCRSTTICVAALMKDVK